MNKYVTFTISAVVLATTLLSLWWFQARLVQPFIPTNSSSAFYQPNTISKELSELLELQQATTTKDNNTNSSTLFHFWNPSCICNRLSQRHFNQIARSFNIDELNIIIIAHSSATQTQIKDAKKLNPNFAFIHEKELKSPLNIPTSPSLAIIDSNQKITYFGPYGFGAFCTMNDDKLLPSIIEKSNDNSASSFINVVGDGCFCDWP